MVRYDGVQNECSTRPVVPSMPDMAPDESAEFERAVHFGVRERFVAAIAPS